MTHTLIIEIDGRKYPYHVCFTDDGEKYLDDMNVRRARVVRAFKGDYVKDIRRFGLINFMGFLENEDPIICIGVNIRT